MKDILFRMEDGVFSYRVAGVCVVNNRVLLQTTTGEDKSFAFPGGHVAFGETNAETLRREFREEIGADISVGDLCWVAEIFFPWGNKPCHQICLYYKVELADSELLRKEVFLGEEHLEGRNFNLEFHWIPIEKTGEIEVYPVQAPQLLEKLDEGVQHFVYREE